MNNENLDKLNYISHDIINNINKIGHELLNTTLETTIPIINTFTSKNFKNNEIELINYTKKYTPDNKINIMCEIPGLSKENCKVNYKDNIIIIHGTTSYIEQWDFVKNKKYYREINIGYVNKNSIKIRYQDGCLFIEIKKKEMVDDSNIEIS